MSNAFSISKSAGARISDPSLRTEINRHTLSEMQTAGILRSLERFGDDASILRYDITPQESARMYAKGKIVSWSVRAVRSPAPGRD